MSKTETSDPDCHGCNPGQTIGISNPIQTHVGESVPDSCIGFLGLGQTERATCRIQF